jgi:outer membrane protein TolC
MPCRIAVFAVLAAILASGEAAPLHLTLAEALRLAHVQGRQTITWHEDLAEEERAYARAVRGYAPIPAASATSGYSGSGIPGRPQQTSSATVSATQTVPGGGSVTVSGTANRTSGPGDTAPEVTGTATVEVKQPILRGAGLEAWRETRTKAERALVNRRRSYELFRFGLTTDIAASFWNLQRDQAAVVQARNGVQRAQFTLDQSQALMAIGKSNANEVFRAETSLLQARQSVVDAEATLAAATDNLKLQLSLDPSLPTTIDTTPPGLTRTTIDAARATAIALERRLDLAAAVDQLADAARGVRLAARGTLPTLDLTGSASWDATMDAGARSDPAADWSAGLALTLPLDDRTETAALDAARLAHVRAQRSLAELRERIVSEVRDAIRRLRTAETTLLIQDRNRLQAQRRAEKAQLDLKAGTLSNRDLVEAQTEVRSAEDAWFAALVAYRIAELGLRRVTGTLVVEPSGMWDPAPPPYALAETP